MVGEGDGEGDKKMNEKCKFKTCEYGYCAIAPTTYANNGQCILEEKP